MDRSIKDREHRVLGRIHERPDGVVEAKDLAGRVLGRFDGKVTRDLSGRVIASGDLTSSLITDDAKKNGRF